MTKENRAELYGKICGDASAFGADTFYSCLFDRLGFYYQRILVLGKGVPLCGAGADYRGSDAGSAMARKSAFFLKMGVFPVALRSGNDLSVG